MKAYVNFEKWAQEKPELLAIIAHTYALQAKPAFNLIMHARNEETMNKKFTQPDLDSWLKMFRSHPNGETFLRNLFKDPTGILDDFISAIDNSDDTNSSSFLKEFHDHFTAKNSLDLLDAYLNFQRLPKNKFERLNPEEEIERKCHSPEFYFALRIFFPCWILYETTPAQLLRKARRRDFDSLISLIKLDPSIIFDRQISRYVHHLRSTRTLKFAKVQTAFMNGLTDKIELLNIKYTYAALISLTSIEFGHKLTAPEIRELFDAVAKDTSENEIDTDFPESPHAFYVALDRNSKKLSRKN